jgi:hypothetical protein
MVLIVIGLRRGIPASKALLYRAVYCINSSLKTFVNVLVFVHGPHLLDALTAHRINKDLKLEKGKEEKNSAGRSRVLLYSPLVT